MNGFRFGVAGVWLGVGPCSGENNGESSRAVPEGARHHFPGGCGSETKQVGRGDEGYRLGGRRC